MSIEYEKDLESADVPTRDMYHAWIKGSIAPSIVIYINSLEYQYCCPQCKADRCWIPEKEVVREYIEEYDCGNVYEHACCCGCHDSEQWNFTGDEDDDLGSDDEVRALPSRSAPENLSGYLFDMEAEHIPILNQLISRSPSSDPAREGK